MRATNLLASGLVVSLVGFGIGCRQDAPTGEPASREPAAAAVPGVSDVKLDSDGPAYAPADLPVAADFEAEAEREITKDGYMGELEAVERELDASVPDASSASTEQARVDANRPPGTERARSQR